MATHDRSEDLSPGSTPTALPSHQRTVKTASYGQPQLPRKGHAAIDYFDGPASPAATESTVVSPYSSGLSSDVQSPLSIATASSWSESSEQPATPRIGEFKRPRFDVTNVEDIEEIAEQLDVRTPAPAHLEQPRLPTIQIEKPTDPVRPWLGVLPNPAAKRDDEDEIAHDFGSQAAVAVQPLPPLPESSVPTDAIERYFPQQQHEPEKLHFNTTLNAYKPRVVDDKKGTLRKKGKRKIAVQKRVFQLSLLSLNAFLIFFTWYFTAYWYALLPIISLAVAMNTIMIISLFGHEMFRKIKPLEREVPETPETLVLLVPCYNENQEEITRSLESLHEQQKIEEHQQCIFIICDGRARGPGMNKSCADILLDDVLTDNQERKFIAGGYTACDQQPMDVTVQRGTYKGIPYVCMIKQQNQGKRDSLIAVRSFLHYFNKRTEQPSTIIKPELFDWLSTWLIQDAQFNKVDCLVGMDADTVLDPDCVFELVQENRLPNTLGVAGYVVVDWKDKPWGLWRLFQNAEYTVTQCVRRLHQGRVTKKVSVLPGACQILRITEETCCDKVLLDKFGAKPQITDGLYKQIMFSASEDGNHVCCVMTTFSKARTRQCLRARAYTDVPVSWSVYLSQRRRWSLGATGNDWLLAFGPHVLWFERILSFVNTATWFLTPFVFAAYCTFIYVLVAHASLFILYLACIMFIPLLYYLFIPFGLLKLSYKEKWQYFAGLFMYLCLGPPCRFIVLCYAVKNMDQFGWGKTRQVINDDGSKANVDNISEHGADSQYSAEDRLRRAGENSAGTTPPAGTPRNASVSAPVMRDAAEEEKRVGTS